MSKMLLLHIMQRFHRSKDSCLWGKKGRCRYNPGDLWHKGDENISFSCSLHLFQLGHPKWCKPPNLYSCMCNKPAQLAVVQKWSQQHLSRASKRTRHLSTRVSFNTDDLKKLKENRQVTQNYTNFSPGHKAPPNYGSKKEVAVKGVATVNVYRKLYSPETDKVCCSLGNGSKLAGTLL